MGRNSDSTAVNSHSTCGSTSRNKIQQLRSGPCIKTTLCLPGEVIMDLAKSGVRKHKQVDDA